tara:strand:- start:48 stop:371 length:324 start_codon:yes stop_codon:yes gene_type:complete
MENTYWNGNGTYQSLADKLREFIPTEGPCSNKKVERFRKAANNYYDIFNNAGCNRGHGIGQMFPGVMGLINESRIYRGRPDWKLISTKVEPKMDEIILETAKKVGLV